jgi:cold shock CspA family protein
MSSNSETESVVRQFGRVKWFNNKTGFGFVTVTDGEHSGKDVFVHHSAIIVSTEQYMYLVQGEYVEFELVKSVDSAHEINAAKVTGIRMGKLMCETRFENRDTRPRDSSNEGDIQSPRSTRPPGRNPPRKNNKKSAPKGDGEGWSYVEKKSSEGPVEESA